MGAINHNVSHLPIQRVPDRMKFLQLCQRVFDAKQRAVSIMACTFIQQHRRYIQIYNPAGIVQSPTILRVDHHAAASCQNNIILGRKIINRLRFSAPESLFPLNFENCRDRHARSFNDLMIGIEKWAGESPRQLAPDSSFTCPHQTDKIYVSTMFHGRDFS